jgi:hypothetical protein
MVGFPHETIPEIEETIDLLARIKPGRFRWSIFFPFINTRAYEIAREGGFIDFDKLESLTNFTDESALDFGPKHNRYLKRLATTFPWHVNARAGLPSSSMYERLIEHADKIGDDEWSDAEERIIELDKRLSSLLDLSGDVHYGYKYNLFTAVRSH